ncbi:MAG: cation:dicarboxylase symporter family transporter [Rickettsiales bacterium]|nr:cation:dicarboxylase symporter family transporter [Rickettsiales bacterium]
MIKIFTKRPSLYIQILIAIFIAIIFAITMPENAIKMKPLGDIFIKLVKMCIPLIIFCTITLAMISGSNSNRIGKIALKTIIYFEIVTTIAMIIGALVAIYFKPGAGINANLVEIDKSLIGVKTTKTSFEDFILNIIPNSFFEAFTKSEILPILFVSIIFGIALSQIKERCKIIIDGINQLSETTFKIIALIMQLAPIGAFGAMSYTIAKFGPESLLSLTKLLACLYITSFLFVIIIFGIILKLCGSSIFKLISHIKEEIFITFGTASSEPALPSLMKKMEKFGCSKAIANFVIPAGYSLNLDGTCISFTMIIIFIAQAFNIQLSNWQIIEIMLILLVSSKGATAIVGSAFITIATTLSMVDTVPVAGLVLILGIDRFMAEARSVTNLIGNATASIVISKLENNFNQQIIEIEE